MFVSFEGIDGAGKSTHIGRLAQALQAHGKPVTLTREPGGTALAEKLRACILHDDMDALTESLLIFAARRDHLEKVIKPALALGHVVLCDRFTDATFAYQGAGRGFDHAILNQLEAWVQSVQKVQKEEGDDTHKHMLQPDLTYWFDVDPRIAAQRLSQARLPDKFESQPEAFFKAVRHGYWERSQADPIRFARIEADQTPEAVYADVYQHAVAKGLIEPQAWDKGARI